MLADDKFVVCEMNFDRQNRVIDSFIIRLAMLLREFVARCRFVLSARILGATIMGAA